MATTKIITEVTDLNAASSTSGLKMPTGGAYSGTPTDGMVRNDTTGSSQSSASTMQHYNGTEWKNYENVTPPPAVFTADYLVVAGGGGGGPNHGGGGGAGGYIYTTGASLSTTVPYPLDVGIGANGGTSGFAGDSGGDSTFNATTATGGGGGGYNNSTGVTGGSGGGGSRGAAAGTGTSGQGNSGGTGVTFSGGGGGGASAAGSNGSTYVGGNGGAGTANSITGTSVFYAGGGGGNGYTASGGTGGVGGGGNGGEYGGGAEYLGTNGALNTGGGGGGNYSDTAAFQQRGMTGGSGIVILRYPTADVSSYAVTGTLDTTADTAYPVANTAYYKLNGDVLDSSGNGYNGVASNLSPYAAGRFGQAGVFNGSSSNIQINGLSTFLGSSSSKSWSCWVKTTSTSGGNRAIISDYNTGVGNYNFDCFMTPGDGKVYLVSNAGGTGGNILSSATINNGVWHHICAVQNTAANTLELYIDSNSQGTISIGTGTRTSPLFIGTYGTGYYWDGSIDQVRIFPSALTAAQVTELYNEGTVVESTDGADSILQFIGGTGTVTFS